MRPVTTHPISQKECRKRTKKRKSQCRHPADGVSTSLLHPPLPALQPLIALPIFSREDSAVERLGTRGEHEIAMAVVNDDHVARRIEAGAP
jgi:hypothetical protein